MPPKVLRESPVQVFWLRAQGTHDKVLPQWRHQGIFISFELLLLPLTKDEAGESAWNEKESEGNETCEYQFDHGEKGKIICTFVFEIRF